MMRAAILLALAAFVAVAAGESAVLVASKEIVNRFAVVDRDLTVRYSIFNVGDSAARDVVLVDTGFDAEKSGFTRISGLPNVTYSSIEAGANVTHSIVVQASVAGYYNMSAAKVTFSSEGEEEAQVVLSSRPIQIPIMHNDDFARAYESHMLEWLIFLAGAVALVYMPLSEFKGTVAKLASSKKD